MTTSSRRSPRLIVLGVLLIVAGALAAVVLWGLGSARLSDDVAGFARAPVGCDTTLDFAESGEYLVFVESAGTLDGIRGDCDVVGDYDAGTQPLDPVITVVDADGEAVALEPAGTGLDYDEDGFVGTATFSIDIADATSHVIRVESPGDDLFVVAIGPDPTEGVAVLRVGGLAAGLVGILLGLAAVLFGSRPSRRAAVSQVWSPAGAAQLGAFAPGQAPQGPPLHG
ncbi:hypothetical protein, partial [Ilumatobacter sp.]|uniref:hypothetical protein n=1 Tax=Ilumatobacter sp. TaxID=1967498 RepID=UPI003C4F940E